jgi:SAM-dependent methyltransferase
VTSAESLRLKDRDYDIVYAANVFHHVTDLGLVLVNIKRHLRSGGMLFSYDPLAYNPVINVYRGMAAKVRTKDEHPLRINDLKVIREVFPDMRHREFWLSALALFLKYYLVNRWDPNICRYWKQMLLESNRTIGWWFQHLLILDCLLCRVWGIRWLCWNTVVWASNDGTALEPK